MSWPRVLHPNWPSSMHPSNSAHSVHSCDHGTRSFHPRHGLYDTEHYHGNINRDLVPTNVSCDHFHSFPQLFETSDIKQRFQNVSCGWKPKTFNRYFQNSPEGCTAEFVGTESPLGDEHCAVSSKKCPAQKGDLLVCGFFCDHVSAADLCRSAPYLKLGSYVRLESNKLKPLMEALATWQDAVHGYIFVNLHPEGRADIYCIINCMKIWDVYIHFIGLPLRA